MNFLSARTSSSPPAYDVNLAARNYTNADDSQDGDVHMMGWIKTLDQILRGEATRPEKLKDGHIELPVWGLVVVILLLAMIYGACMGSYSLFKQIEPGVGLESDRWMQVIASAVKVPALFFLTLIITFPSLYVFNSLVGSRLRFQSVLNLLVAALAVNLAVLASLGPIVAFFSASTTSYAFMKLLNVGVMGFSGMLGLLFLVQTLNRMSQPFPSSERKATSPPDDSKSDSIDATASTEDEAVESLDDEFPVVASLASEQQSTKTPRKPGALDHVPDHVLGRHVTTVFRIWVVVFGLVGAQMGWVLRPFLGNPDQAFSWFRVRESNIFQAIGQALLGFFTGG